jgi:hypothetical protein
MKAKTLVEQLLGEEGQEREPAPHPTQTQSGMSRYPRDEVATRDAQAMVGDGQQPDKFFITIGDEFVDEEPGQTGENYAIGQYDDPVKAQAAFDAVELNGEEGPRYVQIENRLKGLINQRYLLKVVRYEERTRESE